MPVLETRAYAKLNLSLDVLDRRSDGYHEMRMVMQTVTLSDAPGKAGRASMWRFHNLIRFRSSSSSHSALVDICQAKRYNAVSIY